MDAQATQTTGVSLSPAERLIRFTGRLASHWLSGNHEYVLDEIMEERVCSAALMASYMVVALRDGDNSALQSFLMALQQRANQDIRNEGR